MPDLLTDADVGIGNVLSDADVGIASPRSDYDYLAPLPPITKRRQLEIEQVEARNELSPITELLSADQPLIPAPSPSEAAQLMSPIGFRVRPFQRPSGPVADIVFEASKTVAEMPSEMTRPTMLPLAPLAAVPIPGAPVIRHAIPKAMGILFGGEALGHGAADIVTGIEQEDPKLIGRGGGQVVIGGTMAGPVLLPRSRAVALESPSIDVETVPPPVAPLRPFTQARVQPGARAGLVIPSSGELLSRPGPPTQPKPPAPVVPETFAEARDTVIEAIRKADARTLSQIQALFPEARLSREQARVFRNIAFPPVPEPVRPQATVQDILGKRPPEPPPEPGGLPVPKPPKPPAGGPSAVINPQATEVYEPVPEKPVQGQQAVPAKESGVRVSAPQEVVAEVSLTDPVGNTADFYSLPRLRALELSKDPRIARAKQYYGAKTIPDLARLAKARFEQMQAAAKPPAAAPTREESEMQRVQALPEGPAGEAQLVAEDIANAVNAIDTADIAGFSPVPALVRLIRRAARDPAMKTAAEQAMQKIGDAARAQGVPLDTIKNEIAGELKAIYGDDAAEMARHYFGESPEKPASLSPEEQAANQGWRGRIKYEEYDEPSGQWNQRERDIVVSKSTSGKPWRATVFGGAKEAPTPIGHVELSAPEIAGDAKSQLAEQLGRYTRNLEINKSEEQAAAQRKPYDALVAKGVIQPPAPRAGPVGFFPRRSEALGMGEPSMPPTVEDVRRQRARDVAPPPNEPPPSQPSVPPAPETEIKDAPEVKDVMPARNWLASSEFEFKDVPIAGPLVTRAIEVELGYNAQVGRDIVRFNEIKATLTKPEQVRVTTALRAAQKGNRAPLDALPEHLRRAATEIRTYFDEVKEVIIAEKKRELVEALPDARGRAVEDILGGMSEAAAFKKNRLRAAGQSTVRAAIKELQELDNWGPEDYVTNIERGTYRVVDPDGTTVAVAQTRVGAKEKALRYAKENPGVKSLTITDEFDPGIESPTKLSRGQYYRTISKLAKSVGETASEVQRLLREDGTVIAIKPTNKYSGPLQRRRNILKGEDNIFDALPAYAYSVRKKLALDPVLKEVRDSLNKLPENARQQVEELLNDIKGRKTVGDKIVDWALSPLGTKPFGYSRGVNVARKITTIAKLGYRPLTALINRLSGLHHTWTRAGSQWFAEGRRFMKTPEFKELWEANRDYVGDSATAFTEGAKPGDVAWWHPMRMFQAAEHANRPEAFATFYRFAQGELKMQPAEAAAYARFQTRFAQSIYTIGSLPRLLRGPTGRLVGHFKPYLVRELEFMSTLDRRQWPRYLAGFMVLGGPRAMIYFLRSLPILGAAGILYAIEDWLNRKAPRASRGVGGFAGIDATAAVTPQLPSRAEDWAGPTLSGAISLYRDIIQPAMAGEKRDLRDIGKWGASLAPMASYWYDLVESASQREGWTVDDQRRPDYKPSTADKIKMAAGAQPLNKSIDAVERRYLDRLDDITRANRGHLVDRFIRAMDANDPQEMERMIAQFADYGITAKTIKDAMKQRHLEPRERLRQRLLKVLRPKLAEREAEREQP